MIRVLIAALGGVLAGVSLAFGQAGVATLPLAANPPSAETPSENHALFDFNEIFHAPGAWSLDADYVLWVLPHKATPFEVAANAMPGGAGPATATETFGEEHLDDHTISGARFAVGYWWTEKNLFLPGEELPIAGVEGRFFFLGDRSFSFADNNSPTLVRPFFDTNTSTQSAVIIAAPGVATGRINGSVSANLWGGEANFWQNIYYSSPNTTCTVEAMVGLRYLNHDISDKLNRFSHFLPGLTGDMAVLSGDEISESESFIAHNNFFGGQVGIRARTFIEGMVLTGEVGLALGATNEEINIQGSQVRTTPTGAIIVSPGALLALPGNIGRSSQEKFAQVPEGSFTFGVPIMDHWTVSLGVSALYWSRIVRPGDQLTTQIDAVAIPSFPSADPSLGGHPLGIPFKQSDLLLLGLFASAEFRW
jgi:Putative beta barrel porin-7 (BBP7)